MQAFGNELFRIRQAGEWIESAKQRPAPRMIFDRFWLEGELSILFAESGKGKSILGVQIADAITRGWPIGPFRMKLPAQKVLYFDLELSDKQFETRYAFDTEAGWAKTAKKHYQFSPNFLRAQTVAYDDFPRGRFKSFTEYFIEMLKAAVNATGAKVVIIDDLAYLRRGRDRNSEAARLLRDLRELKDAKGLSILVLARTPTRARVSGTVTLADLEGSAQLAGFADNIFAIGGSFSDPSMRYLKLIKQRCCESDFDEANVPMVRIEKQRGSFLSFRFVDFEDERDVIRKSREAYDIELMCNIEHLRNKYGASQREIAEKLRVSKTTVNRYLRIAIREEQAEEDKELKKEKPPTPEQERQRMFNEVILRDAQQCLERQAAERGLPPPPPLRMSDFPSTTQSPAFAPEPADDDQCDCIECLGGNPERCLDSISVTSRSP